MASLELTKTTITRAALSVLGIAIVGVIDYGTGSEIRTYPLYFIPIAYGAWRLGRMPVGLLALLSAVAWVLSNALFGLQLSHFSIWIINFVAQLSAFCLVGLLIVELRRRLRAEQDLSRKDTLSQLPNGRAFREHGEYLVALARRTNKPLTIAYLDLDNFKSVNDSRGHQEGDRALAAAAAAFTRECRESDLLARLGGDEFAVLMPDTGSDTAGVLFERLRRSLGDEMERRGWPITVSIGAMSYVVAPGSLEQAVRDVDALMYRAKQQGRNRVRLEIAEGELAASSVETAPGLADRMPRD